MDGSFGSGQLEPGETFELTIDQPGVFEVFCTLHGTAQGQGMAGVLVVGEAQPLPVSPPIDIAAIKRAVADEDLAIVEAIDRQSQQIDNLVADQALLMQSLEEETSASETGSTPSPTILTVPVESGTGSIWAALAAGLALGLSVAALVVAHRSRRPQDLASELEVLQPSTD